MKNKYLDLVWQLPAVSATLIVRNSHILLSRIQALCRAQVLHESNFRYRSTVHVWRVTDLCGYLLVTPCSYYASDCVRLISTPLRKARLRRTISHTVTDMFSEADDVFFRKIQYKKLMCVLHSYLPDRPDLVISLLLVQN